MVDKKFLDKEGLEYVYNKILKKISGSVKSVEISTIDFSQAPTATIVDGVLKLGIPCPVTDEHINSLIDEKLNAVKKIS